MHVRQSSRANFPYCCIPSTLHSRLAGEHTQLKDELEAVRQDNIQLVREHNHVKQACEELRRLHDDDQREVADMRMLHQQVPVQLSPPLMQIHVELWITFRFTDVNRRSHFYLCLAI